MLLHHWEVRVSQTNMAGNSRYTPHLGPSKLGHRIFIPRPRELYVEYPQLYMAYKSLQALGDKTQHFGPLKEVLLGENHSKLRGI